MLKQIFFVVTVFAILPNNCMNKDNKTAGEGKPNVLSASALQPMLAATASASKQNETTVVLQANDADIVATIQAIAQIKKLALSIAQKVKEEDETSLDLWEMQEPNPYVRTREGLMLDCGYYPSSLITPWGEFAFYGIASYKGGKISNVFKHFRGQMNLEFIENTGETGFQLLRSDDRDIIEFDKDGKKIAEKDLAQCRGTNAFITASLCGYRSSYQITAVQGKPVPKVPIFKDSKGRERSEAIRNNWAEVMARLNLKL